MFQSVSTFLFVVGRLRPHDAPRAPGAGVPARGPAPGPGGRRHVYGRMARALAACGGFLLAVLWMDLMFDAQVWRVSGIPAVDATAVHSIAAYYRRVTTDGSPMNGAIPVVMAVTVAGAGWRALRARGRRRVRLTGLVLAGAAIVLMALRVFPAAVRLGTAADPPDVQVALARAILHDHLLCLGAIALFTVLQLRDRDDAGPGGR
jgi:hypothetical protein